MSVAFLLTIAQGIFNLKINEDESLVNETHIVRVTASDESCMRMKVPHAETKCALLANLYLSEGQKGKVSENKLWANIFKIRSFPPPKHNNRQKNHPLMFIFCFYRIYSYQVIRVWCKKRIGSDNFIDACRKVVCKAFGDKEVGECNRV